MWTNGTNCWGAEVDWVSSLDGEGVEVEIELLDDQDYIILCSWRLLLRGTIIIFVISIWSTAYHRCLKCMLYRLVITQIIKTLVKNKSFYFP